MDIIIPSNADLNTQKMVFIHGHLVMYISFELMWFWITAYKKKQLLYYYYF